MKADKKVEKSVGIDGQSQKLRKEEEKKEE